MLCFHTVLNQILHTVLLVSIIVPDLAEGYKLDVEPTKLTFSGSSRSQKQEYACDLALFSEVKPESVKKASIGKGLFLTIQKKGAVSCSSDARMGNSARLLPGPIAMLQSLLLCNL